MTDHAMNAGQVWYGPQAWSYFSIVIGIVMILIYRWFHVNALNATRKQLLAFTFSMTTYFFAMCSPLAYLGHMASFSAHMFQQSLMYMVFPCLFLVGVPSNWYAHWMKIPSVDRLFRLMTRPLVTVLGFNALFSFYHFPIVFDTAMSHPILHTGYHLLLQVTSFQMWWSMLTPIPEQSRLSDLKKIAYIFGNGVILTPACALIVFADHVLYNTYSNIDPSLQWLSPMDDQQLGGVLMKIIQELSYGIVLATTFFAWHRVERAKDKEEIASITMVFPNGGEA